MKKIILRSLVLLIIVGCNKEELTSPKKVEYIQVEQIDFNSFEEGDVLKNALEYHMKNASHKEKNKAPIDFDKETLLKYEIDSSNIQKIKHNGRTSYTFYVKPQIIKDNFFKNIVLQEQKGGLFKAYLIKYIPSGEMQQFEEHDSYVFEGQREITSLSTTSSELQYSTSGTTYTQVCYTTLEVWCSYGKSHLAGEQCYVEAQEKDDGRLYLSPITTCSYIRNDDYGGYDGGTGGFDDGTGGTGGSSSPDDDIVTNPYNPDGSYTDIKDGDVISHILDLDMIDERPWLGSHPDIYAEIETFLNSNKNADGSYKQNIIEEARMHVKVEMAKDGRWDFTQTGVYMGRPGLTYIAKYKLSDVEAMYLLENGLVLFQSNTKRVINPYDQINLASTEASLEGYYYIYNSDIKRWYEYRLPQSPVSNSCRSRFSFYLFLAKCKTSRKICHATRRYDHLD